MTKTINGFNSQSPKYKIVFFLRGKNLSWVSKCAYFEVKSTTKGNPSGNYIQILKIISCELHARAAASNWNKKSWDK